jgi:hypothetical protein
MFVRANEMGWGGRHDDTTMWTGDSFVWQELFDKIFFLFSRGIHEFVMFIL